MNGDQIRVVHLVTVDQGGAYRAVVRLSDSLCKKGIDSQILLRNKLNPNSIGREYLDSPIKSFVSKAANVINGIINTNGIDGDILGRDISGNKIIKEADIIVIHWVNSFLAPHNVNQLINTGKPIIIMLHDMWHLTGGCHYSGVCEEYTKDCRICAQLPSTSARAKHNLSKKIKNYSGSNVTVVVPSHWMQEVAQNSSVFKQHRIEHIPNCVDTAIYRHIDRSEARRRVGINTDKPVILFSALNGRKSDKYKGFEELLAILGKLGKDKIFLLCAGRIDDVYLKELGLEYKNLGQIRDESVMADTYNAADVTIVPSRQESFGFSVCESLCCSTPVVAFSVGGIKDQIIHKVNGYLARPYDITEFVQGIQYCIENKSTLERSDDVRQNFSEDTVGNRWAEMIGNMV